jgi:hypothetical protein
MQILKCKMGGTDWVPIARLAVDYAILGNRKCDLGWGGILIPLASWIAYV